jgi:NAD(P)-dependent dehydrogenase (short-subunit alcohol dehydrogenase family)
MVGVCIVTGASRGIGARIALRAAQDGFAVAVNYREGREAAEAVCREIESRGGRAVAVAADVSDPSRVAALFDATTRHLGAPTALVNNAAISAGRIPISELDPALLARVIGVDLLGPLYCIAEAVRHMAKSRRGAGGTIVNISSVAARSGGQQLTGYVAAKGGLEAATIGLARELGPEGIRVNVVRPGVIATGAHPMDDAAWVARTAATVPLGRIGSPDEVADAVAWLLSDAASYVTGAILDVSGGR